MDLEARTVDSWPKSYVMVVDQKKKKKSYVMVFINYLQNLIFSEMLMCLFAMVK